jgi:hypothetical protein
MKDILIVGALATLMLAGCNNATKQTSVAVADWNESEGNVTVVVLNNNKYRIKDITIECLGKMQSGTMLHVGSAQKFWTFYPGVPTAITISGISSVQPTYTRECKITAATKDD